jgi:hypothetical protein
MCVPGTQDERRWDPLKYKYFFGPYRKITETLPPFTATNAALREGGKVVPRAGLRPLRRPHVCPEIPANRRVKRAPRWWTEAEERHKIATARNQS